MQGLSAGAHRVHVRFNGASLGELVFSDQEHPEATFPLPAAALHSGENLVSLAAEGGAGDVSLVDVVRLTYPRSYTAAGDALRFLAPGGSSLVIAGFTRPDLVALDVTDPDVPLAVDGRAVAAGSGFDLRLNVPGGPGEVRTLVAMAAGTGLPVPVRADPPSAWHAARGAQLVIVAPADLLASLGPLKSLREGQGLRVALVDVEDVYDEFGFGEKDPAALRDFMAWAALHWRTPPRYLLLVGDASADQRDYLGLGDNDRVPTALIPTQNQGETASDDWFVDFNQDGLPELAVGRLPARTAGEAAWLVTRIVTYETSGSPGGGALLVADRNDIWDFEATTADARALVPPGMAVQ
jgi:hypothetical protein